MKRTLPAAFALLLSWCAHSQFIARNTVFLEAGGAAFFYSVNYERLLFQTPEVALGARAGISYLPSFGKQNRTITGVPLGLSLMKDLRNNFFELGVSSAFLADESDATGTQLNEQVWINSLRIGVRREVVNEGLFWNALAQLSHVSASKSENWPGLSQSNFIPYLSLGAGYSF